MPANDPVNPTVTSDNGLAPNDWWCVPVRAGAGAHLSRFAAVSPSCGANPGCAHRPMRHDLSTVSPPDGSLSNHHRAVRITSCAMGCPQPPSKVGSPLGDWPAKIEDWPIFYL